MDLKILFVFGYPLRTGGHYKSALAMVRYLKKAGHFVTVISGQASVGEIVREYTNAGAEVVELPALKKGRFHPVPRGARSIASIVKKHSADIVHSQDFLSSGRAYLGALIANRPFILTVAGGHQIHLPLPPKCHTILFSQELVDSYSRTTSPKNFYHHLIKARVDRSIHKQEPLDPSFGQRYGLPSSRPRITMAMRLNPEKTPWIRTLMKISEAFGRHRFNVKIMIAGDGPLLPSILQHADLVENLSGGLTTMHSVGPILSMSDMNQFHNYSDIVVGHGRGILEAMACGKPVAVLGENGNGELVTPTTVERIAQFNFSGRHLRYLSPAPVPIDIALAGLLNDPTMQLRLGEFSSHYIKTEMDAQIGTQQLIDVYRKAMGKHGSYLDYIKWFVHSFTARNRHGLRLRVGRMRWKS